MSLQTKTYSVGSFAYQSASNAYVLDLILTEEAVDTAANTSRIHYKLQLRSGENNRFQWEMTGKLSLNGTQVSTATVQHYLDYNSTLVLLSGTAQVPHEQDGTLNMAFEGKLSVPAGNRYAPPTLTVAGTMALTAIARESTIAAAPTEVGGTAVIAVSRKNDAYTHTVAYSFGACAGYFADSVGKHSDEPVQLNAATVLFPIPESFYYQMTDKPSAPCTLTCRTYDGTTQIGEEQTCTFTITANPAKCGPSIQALVVDGNEATQTLTGDPQRLIPGFSVARCSAVTATQYGAAVKQVNVNGMLLDGELDIPNVTGADLLFQVTDSRGYTAQARSEGLILVPYIPLTAKASAVRTDITNGAVLLQLDGKYYDGSFGRVNNELQISCVCDGKAYTLTPQFTDGGYTASIELTGLDYRNTYTLQLTVSDRLQTLPREVTVSKGIPVFDWGENDFAFHVPVSAPCFMGAFPVGGIFMSATDADPADLLGGTWEQITPNGAPEGVYLWQRTE